MTRQERKELERIREFELYLDRVYTISKPDRSDIGQYNNYEWVDDYCGGKI